MDSWFCTARKDEANAGTFDVTAPHTDEP